MSDAWEIVFNRRPLLVPEKWRREFSSSREWRRAKETDRRRKRGDRKRRGHLRITGKGMPSLYREVGSRYLWLSLWGPWETTLERSCFNQSQTGKAYFKKEVLTPHAWYSTWPLNWVSQTLTLHHLVVGLKGARQGSTPTQAACVLTLQVTVSADPLSFDPFVGQPVLSGKLAQDLE